MHLSASLLIKGWGRGRGWGLGGRTQGVKTYISRRKFTHVRLICLELQSTGSFNPLIFRHTLSFNFNHNRAKKLTLNFIHGFKSITLNQQFINFFILIFLTEIKRPIETLITATPKIAKFCTLSKVWSKVIPPPPLH